MPARLACTCRRLLGLALLATAACGTNDEEWCGRDPQSATWTLGAADDPAPLTSTPGEPLLVLQGESSDTCYPTLAVSRLVVEVSGPSRFGSNAFHLENLLVVTHTDLDGNAELDPEDSLHVFEGDAAEVPPGFEYSVILHRDLDEDDGPGGGTSRLGSTQVTLH